MSDRPQNPEELINRLISFIERERKIYGDFTINDKSSGLTTENEVAASPTLPEADKKPEKTETPETSTSDAESSASPDVKEESTSVQDRIKKCTSLDELEALCRRADILRTDLEGTQLVFGVGNPNADLMIIGEAPGADEDKQGEPFVGKAGQLLNKILNAVDFKREDVYIANILKHRPPNNRNPKPEERERSLPFLLHQIELIQPKLILSLGKVSAQTLLDMNTSLSRMRGKFHSFRGQYELLATYHPAALLRNPRWKRATWEDVQLLKKRYDELDGKP